MNQLLKWLAAGTVAFFLCGGLAFGQTFKWLKGGGTNMSLASETKQERVFFMCTDFNRNIYSLSVVGNTAITADTFYRPSAYGSFQNVLFTSHDCNGQMRFAKLISCNDATPCGVVTDNAGHVYLALDLPHYATSSATTLRIGYDTTITTHINNRMTLVQYDTSGHLNWLRYVGENALATFNGTGSWSNYLALDGSGNAHLVVIAKYGVNLTPSLVSHMGYYDIAYNSSGGLLGINKLQIDSTLLVYGIAIDKQSNKMYAYGIRYTGMFPGTTKYPYITALDPMRNLIWVDTIANPYYPNSGNFTSIITDGLGHLYGTVASSKGFIYCGDTALNVLGIPNAITTIVKMDTAGDLKWMRVYSSTVSSGISRVEMMPNNRVVVCGSIAGGKIVSGADTLYVYPGEGQNAIFSIVDSAGYIQTFQQMHGPGFYDNGDVCTSDKVGNLYIGGHVESSISGGSLPPYTSVGGDSDYFIVKYGVDCRCISMPLADYTYSGTDLTRSFIYTGTMTGIDSVRWSFEDGGTTTSMTPIHTYTGAGTFTTCVKVYSTCGNDMRCYEVTVACAAAVTSAFTDTGILVHGFTYTGTLAGYDSVVWDFGDSVKDTGLITTHTYAIADTYHVCAKVYTNCGTHTFCRDLFLGVPGLTPPVALANISVFPNPATSELYVTGIDRKTEYRLLDIVGVVMETGAFNAGTNILQTRQLSPGLYLLELNGVDGSKRVMRIMKQ